MERILLIQIYHIYTLFHQKCLTDEIYDRIGHTQEIRPNQYVTVAVTYPTEYSFYLFARNIISNVSHARSNLKCNVIKSVYYIWHYITLEVATLVSC